MFDLVHEMRTRIITSPAFNGDRILGAILFEMTMDREIEGRRTADYLWNVKKVVPFLKIDKGLADEADGAQTDEADAWPRRAARARRRQGHLRHQGALGHQAAPTQAWTPSSPSSSRSRRQVLATGLVPILEPEVDIKSPQKAEAEDLLKAGPARRRQQAR